MIVVDVRRLVCRVLRHRWSEWYVRGPLARRRRPEREARVCRRCSRVDYR